MPEMLVNVNMVNVDRWFKHILIAPEEVLVYQSLPPVVTFIVTFIVTQL